MAKVLNPKSLTIHERAMKRGANFRQATADILESLREVEGDKTYVKLGVKSLFAYSVKFMSLSPDVAYSLITIMRKSRVVPELTEKIKDGSITPSSAKRLCAVITQDNKAAWLELAETKSCQVLEKEIAKVNPQAAVTESVQYKTEDRLELKLGVSEEFIENLKLAKDVASQKAKRAVSTEEMFVTAVKEYLERHDPLKKAERARLRSEKKKTAKAAESANAQNELVTRRVSTARAESSQAVAKEVARSEPSSNPETELVTRRVVGVKPESASKPKPVWQKAKPVPLAERRKPLSAAVKYAATLRDQRQCRHIDHDGHRCEEKRWLDVHHIVEVSRGGKNELSNLTTLCSFHHRNGIKSGSAGAATASHCESGSGRIRSV